MQTIKLNLGCGFRKLEGYVNVDQSPLCQPDEVVDLEKLPWPWRDNSVSEIIANHVLEHLGKSTDIWLGIIKELWRVCTPDAVVKIAVPHPRHDNFLHDPTHVRAITPIGLAMFDQQRNILDYQAGGQETKLGLMTGVDLQVTEVAYDLCEPWRSRYVQGLLSSEQAEMELRERSNFCEQIRVALRIMKPPRGESWKPYT